MSNIRVNFTQNRVDESYLYPSFDCTSAVDLMATHFFPDSSGRIYTYLTGLRFDVPKDYVGLILPKETAIHRGLIVHISTIDSLVKPEITVKIAAFVEKPQWYAVNDIVAMMLIMPVANASFIKKTQAE